MAEEWVVHPTMGMININNADQLPDAAPRVGPYLKQYDTNEAALQAVHADYNGGTRRRNTNPVVPFLEWDPNTALEKVQLSQIATLRSCLRLYDTETGEIKREFIGIREGRGPAKRYYAPAQIIDNRALQRSLMQQAIAALDRIKDNFGELADLCQGVERLQTELRDKISRL